MSQARRGGRRQPPALHLPLGAEGTAGLATALRTQDGRRRVCRYSQALEFYINFTNS